MIEHNSIPNMAAGDHQQFFSGCHVVESSLI